MKLFKNYSYTSDLENFKVNEHLESFLNYKEFRYINKRLNNVFSKVNKIIENKFFYKKYNYIQPNLDFFTVNRVVANLFHKLLILNKVHKNSKLKIIELEVFQQELNFFDKSGANGFDFERFVNLYAMLGTYIGKPFKFKILDTNHKKKKIKYEPLTKAKNSFLKYINFNLSTLIFTFLKRSNFIKFNKKIFTHKYNPLIKEILPELYKKKIGDFNIHEELKKIYFDYKDDNFKDNIEIRKSNKIIFNILKKNTIILKDEFNISSKFFIGYLKILADVASRNIYFLHRRKKRLRQKVKDLKNYNNIYPLCLTNGLFGSQGLAYADALIDNNIKIIGCQHTNKGIHLNEFYGINESECRTSHAIFTYNKASKSVLSKKKNYAQKIYTIGAPFEVKNLRLRKLQKILNKFRLKTSHPTIYYVSHNIELNSEKSFPNTKNNIDLLRDELKMIEILGKVNKNSIFKSYPTRQYLIDNRKYLEKKIRKYKNIKYLNYEEDFRYSRSVSDIIITQSSQSTLGFCLGVKVPLVFLESKYYNSLLDKDVKKAFKESFFFFNYDKLGWEQELLSFLNKPYNEILKLWNEKEKYRKKYDDIYFLSSKKKAGKLGANLINEFIKK